MANTKQAKKMINKIKRRTQYNRWWKKKLKTSIKSFYLKNNKKTSDFSILQKTIDKAAKNKVIHKNKANRIKSKASKIISNTQGKKTDRKDNQNTRKKTSRKAKKETK